METEFTGYFVGPADPKRLAAALQTAGASHFEVIDSVGIGTWARTDGELPASALAAALGDGVWMLLVHLQNDAEADGDGESELMDSHSGTVSARRWSQPEQEFGLLVEDEIFGEGFIRGGVMMHVALEYAQRTVADAGDAAADDIARPTRAPTPKTPTPGRRLLAMLVQRGDLELASDEAANSLAWRVERGLDYASSHKAATHILATLDDADEVVEAFIEENGLATLIDELRASLQRDP